MDGSQVSKISDDLILIMSFYQIMRDKSQKEDWKILYLAISE